jgi:hypothetical protein
MEKARLRSLKLPSVGLRLAQDGMLSRAFEPLCCDNERLSRFYNDSQVERI